MEADEELAEVLLAHHQIVNVDFQPLFPGCRGRHRQLSDLGSARVRLAPNVRLVGARAVKQLGQVET